MRHASTAAVSLLVAALAIGCVTEEEFAKDAIPTAETLRIDLPESSARSVGQVAEFYALTRQVTRDLNGGAAWVLILVHLIVDNYPPTSTDGNVYTWGPWDDGPLAPATWRLVVTANDDGTYDWQLEGQSKSSPEDGFLTVLDGHAVPGAEKNRGSGEFTIDFDTGERVNPIDNTPDTGKIRVTYDLENRDGTAALITMHAEGIDSLGNPGSFDYAYSEKEDGSGDFQFALDADLEENGSAAEEAFIRSRWLATGAGRADATVGGGDLGALEVVASECWDTQFRRSFYTDTADWAPTEGDPASCVYDDQTLPDM